MERDEIVTWLSGASGPIVSTSARPSVSILIILSVAFVLYNVISAIYLAYFHPLSKFPGPKIWATTRLPLAWHAINGETWLALEKLHARYGPIVRIAPDELTTTSPTCWDGIYTSRPVLPKDPYSQTPPLNGAHSLFTAVGETHKRIRAALVNAFSDKALRDQSPIIESYANSLIARLRRECFKMPDGSVDIQKYYGYATLDLISDLTFGESFHGLDGDNDHDLIKLFFLHAKFGNVRNILSRFAPFDKLFGFFFLRITRKARLQNWQVTTAKIRRRLAMGDMTGLRSDFITPVVGKVNEGKVKGITMDELTTNGLGVVIAGCQLTTVALATATYLLLRYPATLRELVREIRHSKFKQEKDISVQSTQGLPYLEAVISETLRIHHPTPIPLPRIVPKGGQMIDGNLIPGGTVIGVNLQNIQNAPTNWVEPRIFHPERFLPPSDERYDSCFDNDCKAGFLPFSTGPRNCLGGKVFLAEARMMLAKVLWNFDLEAVNAADSTWMQQKAYLVFEPKPLMVKITERQV